MVFSLTRTYSVDGDFANVDTLRIHLMGRDLTTERFAVLEARVLAREVPVEPRDDELDASHAASLGQDVQGRQA
jgi:hypothetical protein